MATVQELIDELQNRIDDGLDPDTEIVGVFQPGYPLSTTEIYITDTQETACENNSDETDESTLYIGLGQGYNYASGEVYNQGIKL